jgi:hypothetical protein
MQTPHFTYEELTPLEQCIVDFMRRQGRERQTSPRKKETRRKELADA